MQQLLKFSTLLIERPNRVVMTHMGELADERKQICVCVGVGLFLLEKSNKSPVK